MGYFLTVALEYKYAMLSRTDEYWCLENGEKKNQDISEYSKILSGIRAPFNSVEEK